MSGGGRRGDPFAGQPGRRLFVAVPLPGDAVAAVAGVVESVRTQPLPPGMHDVRWVRLDGLHLTVRFLGPTPDERIEPTASAVRDLAAQTAPIDIRLAGTGTFPDRGRPRALWIGLADGVDALTALTGRADEALAAAGWPRDGRPYRPHLTLARSDGLVAGTLVASRLATTLGDRVIHAHLDRLVLYESVTGGGPARYEPVDEARFGA